MPVATAVATDALNWVLASPIISAELALLAYVLYKVIKVMVYQPLTSPLDALPGPPKPGKFFDLSNIFLALDTVNSQRNQQEMRDQYGKNMHIQGFGYWDQRLLTFDSRAINYILHQATELYPKAWQSRRMLSRLLGEGVAITEGEQHKRQRRVINPAFAPAALRKLDPVFRSKAEELRDRWLGLLSPTPTPEGYTTLDVNHWISRATFDAFALAGFSYSFNAIQNEDHPVYMAYKKMFDAALNKGQTLMGFFEVYLPWLTYLPTEVNRQINASKKVILEAGQELIREKRQALMKELDEEKGRETGGKDLMTVLIKSNLEETSPKQRLSDTELLSQIHSFLFVGSDSVSLSISWTLWELSQNIPLQTRVRDELLAARQSSPSQDIASLPLLDALVKESLRVTPPLQSTLRSATRDDIIPTEDGKNGIKIRAGQLIHLPLEGMNIAKEIWGEDAWEFKPDRWFNLPEAAKRTPGLVSNLMSFSIGPHSCPGVHFAIMEMKAFLAELISSFEFAAIPKKRILKGNVMVTRPFVAGEWDKGTQMPMLVRPYSSKPSAEA